MKTRMVLTLVVLVAALAPLSARATHCASRLVVHGYTDGLVDGSPGPELCLFDDGHTLPVDYRVLSPGATEVLFQYLTDVGPSLTTTTGTVDGLGFHDQPITYNRYDAGAGLGFAYETAIIPIPDGATASGCLTFTFKLGEDGAGNADDETNRYHTAGASCPDYP